MSEGRFFREGTRVCVRARARARIKVGGIDIDVQALLNDSNTIVRDEVGVPVLPNTLSLRARSAFTHTRTLHALLLEV